MLFSPLKYTHIPAPPHPTPITISLTTRAASDSSDIEQIDYQLCEALSRACVVSHPINSTQ